MMHRRMKAPPNSRRIFLNAASFVIAMLIAGFIGYSYLSMKTDIRIYVERIVEPLESLKSIKIGEKQNKTILLWTSYFSATGNWLPTTDKLNCSVKECLVTSDHSLWSSSSAVIVHWRDFDPDDSPPPCNPHAGHCPLLVLFNKEPPPNTPSGIVEILKNRVDWLATYRMDSDIFVPYGRIVEKSRPFQAIDMNSKRSTVCWLVSNCVTASKREDYVAELKRHIDVETYGRCGSETCNNMTAMDCHRWLSRLCKFYLSFENSICKDYATEKLFDVLMTDMVPVVLGGYDYAMYLPAHSYIDVADFKDPAELAKYLEELDRDDQRYLEYFTWKSTQSAEFIPYVWLCDLCEKLHRVERRNVSPHDNFLSWWFDKAKCGSLA